VNWPRLLRQFPAGQGPALFAGLVAEQGRATVQSQNGTHPPQPALLPRLEAAATDEVRRAILLEYVQEQIARVLGLDPAQPLDPHRGLTDAGMDSLMAVELSNRLRNGLGRALPTTLAFEYPTIADLTEYLARDVLSLYSSTSGGPEALESKSDTETALLAELEGLTEAEIEASLLEELENAGY
jgi:acyl carrier protein